MCYNKILSKGIDIMNWVEMDIYTTTEGIEAVTGSLLGMGINGFVIKDAKDFQDFLDDKDGNWDYIDDDLMGLKNCETTVTVYLPENAQGLENLEAMKLELKALKKRDVNNEFGRLEYELKNVKEEDWANNWKQYFKPLCVGEKLLIKPSWEKVAEGEKRKILEIDPASSFGTGQHNTTQLWSLWRKISMRATVYLTLGAEAEYFLSAHCSLVLKVQQRWMLTKILLR